MKKYLGLFLLILISDNTFCQVDLNLPEVQINGAKIQLAYDRQDITIIDYEFHEGGLLLLLRDKYKYHLRWTDNSSNIIFDTLIPKNPKHFFIDCFGNTHIIYKEEVYQIQFFESKISLFAPFSIELFNEKLKPYVFKSEGDLYWQEFTDHNQAVTYLKQGKNSQLETVMYKIADSILVGSVKEFYDKSNYLASVAPNPMGEINIPELYQTREVKERFWLYEFSLSLPVYNPFFLVKDSIIIFDHVANKAVILNSFGKFERSFLIAHHLQPGWDKEIILDKETSSFYSKVVRNGIVYLQRVNRLDGRIDGEFAISEHAYPDQIKIRDGWAYYLYKKNETNSVPNVFRQRLR